MWRGWRLSDRAAIGTAASVGFTVCFLVLFMWNAYLVGYMADELYMNDFGKFYYSAQSFLNGQDMYGPSPATLIPVTESLEMEFWNLNPPHFHLPVLPLALLEPRLALAIWLGLGLLALAGSTALIVRQVGWRITPSRLTWGLLALLVFPGTAAMCGTGQISWLLLLLVTIMWIDARRGRWSRVGIWLGLAMSVKPFFLIFVPYLLLRRRIGAVVASLVVAALCFALGLLVFGLDAHLSWLEVLDESSWEWAAMNGSIMGLVTRAFGSSPYYSPLVEAPGLVKPLWLVMAGLVGVVTVVGATLGRGQRGLDRGFALLLIASQLISPLGWIYYLWLPLGPVAAVVVRAWRERRKGGTISRAILWRNRLALAAIPGLVWPIPAAMVFQPNPLATVTIGSIYCWSMLALWLALVADWWGRLDSLPRACRSVFGRLPASWLAQRWMNGPRLAGQAEGRGR